MSVAPNIGSRVLPRAVILALALVLALVGTGCAGPALQPAVSSAAPEQSPHRIWVVHHGYHTGIAVAAADVPPQAWPARRDFPQAQFLEVGWGDRDFYMAPAAGLRLATRALFWPTPSVLHVAAFDRPPDRHFTESGIVELALAPSGFAALVAAVRDSHQRVGTADGLDGSEPWLPPLGPGLYGASRFYASHERFHPFRNCNVWVADVLARAGVPLSPASALTAGALFRQLRAHGSVLREPP
jgi:uncharacterized protein (TIGR02117 family)